MRFLLCLVLLLTAFARPVAAQSVEAPIADAFDFPVGIPDAADYYKARGFRPNGHLGEDWNGSGGGDSDLGDPVYAIGNGVVVLAVDYKLGWGNVVILRHAYNEGGAIRYIDSLYGHLDQFLVKKGDQIKRGQKIGTIGDAHGIYPAHLHFEIRRDLRIGMQRSAFARDFSSYFDPSDFIKKHRHLAASPARATIALETFTHPQTPGDSQSGSHREFVSSNRPDPNLRQRITAKRNYFKVERYGDLVR